MAERQPATHADGEATNANADASTAVTHIKASGSVELPERLRPLPPAPTIPPVALEEDEYVAAMDTIIKRDFFPSLDRLRTQTAFLDAVQDMDLARARTLGFELARMSGKAGTALSSIAASSPCASTIGIGTPSAALKPGQQTPRAPGSSTGGIDTPVASTASANHSRADHAASIPDPRTQEDNDHAMIDTSLSLDAFQAKYTSQDNASFHTILTKQNEALRDRYKWVFDAEKKAMMLQSSADELGRDDGDGVSVTRDGRVEHLKQLMIDAPGSSTTKSIQTWKYRTKNTLMYDPEGAPLTKADFLESRGEPKKVVHAATRFVQPEGTISSSELMNASSAQSRSSHSRINTEEVWSKMATATPSLFPGRSNSHGASSTASPGVGGFKFVAATPSPAPHVDIDPSELMSWGFVEGTPILLDSGAGHGPAGSGPSFALPPTPRRDEIAMRLSARAAKSNKKRAETNATSKFLSSATPSPLGWSISHKTSVSRIGTPSVASSSSSSSSALPSSMLKRGLSPAACALLESRTKSPMISSGQSISKLSRTAAGQASTGPQRLSVTSNFDPKLRSLYSGTPHRRTGSRRRDGNATATPTVSTASPSPASLTPSVPSKSATTTTDSG